MIAQLITKKSKFFFTFFRFTDTESRESANDVVDRVLEKVNYNIMRLGLDPTELPDAINKFEWVK